MSETRVVDWPTYIFHAPRERDNAGQGRGISLTPNLRRALSREAAELDVSVADTIRGILCAHYSLDCPRVSSGYDAERDTGSLGMVMRLQPELFRALREDAEEREESLRHLIIAILEAHYAVT